MAKRTMVVSDLSGEEIDDGKGAEIRITFHDARRGIKVLDVTEKEADELGGRPAKRRGRPPKNGK